MFLRVTLILKTNTKTDEIGKKRSAHSHKLLVPFKRFLVNTTMNVLFQGCFSLIKLLLWIVDNRERI